MHTLFRLSMYDLVKTQKNDFVWTHVYIVQTEEVCGALVQGDDVGRWAYSHYEKVK